MFSSWLKKFSSQPHQSFFTFGIIFLILFMSLFTAAYMGLLNIGYSVLTYHAYVMVFVLFIQFFLGFLYVVFPKFLMQSEIPSSIYMKHFYLYFISSFGILISLIFSSSVYILFSLLLIFVQILSFKLLFDMHKKSISLSKNDTKWILISYASGIISHIIYLISIFDFEYNTILQRISLNAGFYLFLFALIFSIAQRMVPFFTRGKTPGYVINKSKNLMPIVYSLLVFKVIILSFDNSSFNILSDLPLFVFFLRELIKWNFPIKNTIPIMWILYLAIFWIPIGFLLSITESLVSILDIDFYFEKAVLHTFALGFFLTILIGFGTRVILGHSGRTPSANKFTIFIFIFVQFIVLMRIIASLFINTELYINTLVLSSFMLILGLLLWSSKYLKILLEGK
ncbi:MAG: NnrS family protein [Campylobacteraceae bacterium]|nr:NnrS family protein [Campylobacteraceae bacterium]